MNRTRFNISMLFVGLIILLGCETKIYKDNKFNPASHGGEDGSFFSKASFAGVSLVTDVTDSTADVHWNDSSSAAEYEVYFVKSGTEVLI